MRPALLVSLLATAAPVSAADRCEETCGIDVSCWKRVVECFVDAGTPRRAIDALKPVVSEDPRDAALGLLLARAYAADDNPLWAQRTLHGLLARDESDCATRAHLAWVHIQQGDLALAREILEESACPRSDAERARWHLLSAYIHGIEASTQAATELEAVETAREAFSEDVSLFRDLRRRHDPGWIKPVTSTLEVMGGYTTNGLAGAPPSIATQGGGPSGLLRVDAVTILTVPFSGKVRPLVEAGLKGHALAAEVLQSLSYLELSARPGILVGRTMPRTTLAYAAGLTLLQHPEIDRPTEADLELSDRFSEGHRVEVDVELSDVFTLLAGGGRRVFRKGGRTRWEADGAVAGSFAVHSQLRLVAVLAGRIYSAKTDPYDQVGATALVVARMQPGWGMLTRVGATFGLDDYPGSGGERGRIAHGGKRRDTLLKLSAGLWSPPFADIRLGCRYELAWRNSTAEDYGYTEHRVLLGARWAFSFDPTGPRALSEEGRVALDYGIGEVAAAEDERIRDLLRQDEAARRGSSCVN
ncbi:hypothetical protein ACFL6C_09775 [Myxococcota bacterium]